jgi:hypothetical protein
MTNVGKIWYYNRDIFEGIEPSTKHKGMFLGRENVSVTRSNPSWVISVYYALSSTHQR